MRVHGLYYARFNVNSNPLSKIFLINAGQWPLVVARGHHPPSTLQQLLTLFALVSPQALVLLSGCLAAAGVLLHGAATATWAGSMGTLAQA